MALTAGTKLGPYEIVGELGAGGMGEVYRARDTRLDRTVAFKSCPSIYPLIQDAAPVLNAKPVRSPAFRTRTYAPSSTLATKTVSTMSYSNTSKGETSRNAS